MKKSLVIIPVSLGELFDKISILDIKIERIDDVEKLKNIKKELDMLKEISSQFKIPDELYQRLKDVNEEMWDAEDGRREKEKIKAFDKEFIELARVDHFKNDLRAIIKREINELLKSYIMEEKSYKNTDKKFYYDM